MSLRHPKERVSRRQFLRAGAAAAAGIPAASALLAACKNPNASTSQGVQKLVISSKESPTPLPTFSDNPPIDSNLPLEAGPLKLYNWDQYIYMQVVKDFQKKYNVEVQVSTFNNGDEALSKIRSTEVDFDVFFPTTDMMGKMTQFRLLQPLNHDYLPNMKNLWPFYTKPGTPWYDVGSIYTVPYTVYSTGIGWRNDMVAKSDDPWHISNPWDLLWNPKYKGKIGIYDDYREATGMALLRNGDMDINTGDPTALTDAKNALIDEISKVNVALDINGAYEDLPKGIFAAHEAWSGDMIAAQFYGKENAAQTAPLLSYWWPKEGNAPVGNDLIAILHSSKNPVLAHTFLNYLLDFDVAMLNFSWNGYQPPQNEAPPEVFLNPNFKWAWVVPPNLNNTVVQFKDMENGLWYHELTPEVDAIWHDNWEQFTAGV